MIHLHTLVLAVLATISTTFVYAVEMPKTMHRADLGEMNYQYELVYGGTEK